MVGPAFVDAKMIFQYSNRSNLTFDFTILTNNFYLQFENDDTKHL